MRNLVLISTSRTKLDAELFLSISQVACLNNEIYVVCYGDLFVYSPDSTEPVHTYENVFKEDVRLVGCLETENALWFLDGKRFVCIKDRVLHQLTLPDQIDSVAWNPNQHVVAITTADGRLAIFHPYYSDELELSLIEEVSLLDDKNDCSKDAFVNVGWGSSETQFKGANARLLKNVQEEKEVCVETGIEDSKSYISWRGNGEMFVVNYEHKGGRRLKVFQYPCQLLFSSPVILGLQPVIAWNPKGNRIAAVIWTNKRCELAIFEKNCLYRSSFSLHRKDYIKELHWNPSGDVLLVSQIASANKPYYYTLDLYMTKNGVWYLKQRLEYTAQNPLNRFEFLPANDVTYSLRVFTCSEITEYTFKLGVACSPISYNDNGLICASINGSNVAFTWCKEGLEPPPFNNFIQKFEKPINFVIFHPSESKVIIVDSSSSIRLFEISEDALMYVCEKTSKSLSKGVLHSTSFVPLEFYHFTWKQVSGVSKIVCFKNLSKGSTLIEFDLDNTDDVVDYKWWSQEQKSVSYFLEYIPSKSVFLVQIENSIFFRSEGQEDTVLATSDYSPLCIRWFEIDNKVWVFFLNTLNKFYVNNIEVLQGISSFIIHENYLLLTSKTKGLMVVRLCDDKFLGEFIRQDFSNVQIREIEQGSYLLFAIPNTSLIVLQMPRGNVETISVRMISLDKIECLVQQDKWDVALFSARVERLNLNVLVDFDADRFISKIPEFIKSVSNPSIIDSFLINLNDENSINTLYKNCYAKKIIEMPSKCKKISENFIKHLQSVNYAGYATTIIIACFVKDSTSASITEALFHIRNFLFSNQVVVAEKALRTIQTMRPDTELLDFALKTGDLDLARFVGIRTPKKDPKEYESFIAKLEVCEPSERAFQINHYVKDYKSAIKFLLLRSQDVDEIVSYVKEHKVYKEAFVACLKLTAVASYPRDIIWKIGELYAEQLSCKNLYWEAASVYEHVNLLEDAGREYVRARAWKECYIIADKLKDKITYLSKMVTEQINSGDILEAANTYDKYLDDEESAIILLAKNNQFSEAIRMLKKIDRNDIYETHVFPAIKLHASNLTQKFNELQTKFEKNKQRLLNVRASKRNQAEICQNHFEDDLEIGLNFEDDIASLADTIASTISIRSTTSRFSTMSSRNRRKLERKKMDTRPGSLYEDIALMKEIHELISEAFGWGSPVREMCLSVLSYSCKFLEEGYRIVENVHNLLLVTQRNMERGISEVWPANINNLKMMDDLHASEVYANIDVLDMVYRFPPQNVNFTWKLSVFKE